MANLASVLEEYVHTVNNPDYGGDLNVINSKFPELANIDPTVLEEYVYTANNPGYAGNYNIINGKFPELFGGPTTPTSTSTSTSKSKSKSKTKTEKKEEPTFVNTEFWENQKYARENYTYRDGKWYYKSPKSGKEVEISKTHKGKTSASSTIQRLEELQKEREAELNYKRSKLELEKDLLNNKEEKTKEDIQKELEIDNQINSIGTETSIDEEEKNKQKKEQGFLKMPEVTKDITEKDDEDAVEELNKKYGEYGFTFRVDEDGTDQVFVTSNYDENGKLVPGGVTEVFKFDQGAIFDDDEKNSDEAFDMDYWMRKRAVKQSSAKTLQNILVDNKTDEQREEEGKESITTNVKHAVTTEYVNNSRSAIPLKLSDLDRNNLPEGFEKIADDYWDGNIDALINFMYGYKSVSTMVDNKSGMPIKDKSDKYLRGSKAETREYFGGGSITTYETFDNNDVSRKQDIEQVIISYAISKWQEENPGVEFDEKNPEHHSSVMEIKNIANQEWQELSKPENEEDMFESDIYKSIIETSRATIKAKDIQENIRDYAEDQDGNVFWKGASQKLSAEKAEEEFDKLKQQSKDLLNEQSAIEETITVSDKKLKETLKWFEDNNIDAQIKEIRSKKYNTQEEADAAQEKINSLVNGFNSKLQEYNDAKFNLEQAVITGKTLQRDFTEIIENREDFKEISKYLNQNYQWGTLTIKSLGDAGADLLQGIATAAEVIYNLPGIVAKESSRALLDYAALNPDSSVGKFVNSPVINSGLHGTEAVGDFYTNSRFDDDPTTRSIPQRLHDAVDDFQKSNIMNVADPTAFGEIDGWGDFGKWTSSMLASQAPQLALLIASGGSSMLTQTALLTASAGGQKFLGYEEERDLYLESGGLYGKNYSFGNMILSSTAVGLAEALSERITYGQIKGVSAGLKRANLELLEQQVKGTFKRGFSREYVRGYFQHMGKTVLNPKLMAYAGYQRFEEGVSESVATISENLIGLANGEDISVWDNVDQAFVSGVIMSQAISSPVLFNQMSAPFRATNTQGILNSNTTRMEKLLQELHSSDNLDPVREQEIIEEYKNLKEESMKVMELDVKRVDAMNEFEKGKLLEIHKSQKKAIKEATSLQTQLNNGEITQEQFDQKYNELNNQYSNRENQKQKILDKYDVNVINVTYEQTMNSMRDKAKEINNASEGSINIDIQEGNDGDLVQWQIENEGYTVDESDADGNPTRIIMKENNRKGKIKEFKNQLNDPNLTAKERSAIESNLKVLESGVDVGMDINQYNEIMNNSSNYGSFVPQYDSDGNYTGQKIFINKNASHDGGEFSIASHEFMHGLLYSTLKGDMRTQDALTQTILNTLKQKGVKIPDAVMAKINSYAQDGTKGEEIMTVLSQAISDEVIKLPKTALGGFKNFYRRYGYNHHGVAIEFDTDQDVINFLKDYTYSMKNNKQNKALTNMFIHGASGDLIQKQQRYRDLRKKYRDNAGERAKQTMFSKNIDQEIRNNPDLLTEIDAFVKNEDGSTKYTDNDTWQNSVDFTDAYMYITQKKSLDGLIQAGMVGEGVNTPQALGEFTRKVKDELGERLFKNFDPAKNDSLFGWLTGVSGGMGKSIIYRAKGDVMVEYSKQIKAVSLDKGMTTEGGDTFSSQLEGETDTEMERLESEDLTIGKTTVKKSDVDIVFLESVNADPTIVKSINNIVENSGVNLEGLTYNGTKKNLVQHDGSKPKSKRKPVGPLYKVLDIVSNEFGVDGMRIIKEQDLTTTHRTLAREYINEHADKLIDMLPEGENRSGDATGVANTVLGEFYVKGERISMAESGSGKGKVSQTKRSDITTNEFIEFFNKPGTKSDGAIRALITQAATISANQAIRLNAISKQSDPISTIALVGDGKSAIMFSKRNKIPNLKDADKIPDYKRLGAFDSRLYNKNSNIFWNRVDQLAGTMAANNAIPLRNKQGEIINEDFAKRSIEEMIIDVYSDTFTTSEINELSESVYDIVSSKPLKYSTEVENKIKNRTAQDTVEKQSAIVEALYTSKQNANTKISSFVGAGVTTASLGNDTDLMDVSRARIKTYVDTRVEEIKKEYAGQGDAVIGGQIIKMLSEQMDQHTTAGKVWDGRQQLFAATPDFVLNIASKIPGLNFAIKVASDGKTEIDTKTATYDSNSRIKRSSDNLLSTDTRSKRSEKLSQKDVNKRKSSVFTKLDNNLPGTTIQQQRFKNYSQSGPSLITDFIFDKNKVSERKQDALNAQLELNNFVRFIAKEYKEGRMSERELQVHMATLLSNMKPTLARAAMPKYIAKSLLPEGYQSMSKAQIKAHLKKNGAVYEHMQPRVGMVIHLFNQHINGNGVTDTQVPDFFSRYNIAVIPEAMDKKAINAVGLRESLATGQTMTMPEWMRYYNVDTEQKMEHLDSLIDIDTGIELEPTAHISKTKELLNSQRSEAIYLSKAVNQANTTNENTPSRGMSAFDFDETLIDKGENTIIATSPEGKEVTITSGQWPVKGPKLAQDGYTFDFSDFVNVKGGVEGPLMQKFKNRIEKFGIENNYILTARPAEAAPAIQDWLKEQGIDMPLENITGLGNSTGAAKAQWMVEKFAEGYNDMYFVDDALPNVKAVKDVMDQLDIKGSSVQAKIQFSKRIDPEFNNILNGNVQAELDLNRVLEQTKGVKAEARYSDAQAKVQGSKKGKWKFWVPPSAEDFKGLIYRFIGKGRIGEQQMAFFKKALFDPFSRANEVMNNSKQRLEGEYRALLKEFPSVKSLLNSVVYNNFTLGQMVRVYNWNKAGFEIPGLAQRDLDAIIKEVEGDADTLAFAKSLSIISNQEAGYTQPGDFWMVENIQSDINKINNELDRAYHLKEWKQNIESMFGVWENGKLVGPNMNKIEAIYGSNFREALEDIVWRMEYGSKRQQGGNRLVNRFNNWANQSVGAIMFLNMRSALLQTISSINYLNWSDNNPLKAGLALANAPQFIKDFSMIFNSDMLKQRRAGNQRGINEAELAEAVAGSNFSPKAILHYLLTKGFLPTQIADSFAISSGGATFYRNRVNSLLKKGMTQEQAESRAWQDFQENTEESQQSSRPDMISQQQASPLGRYILAFKNTPMQYARLMKKAWLDIANGRGDFKTNLGKIIYYGAVQNLIFSGLQAAMGAMLGDDDEEKDAKTYERVANSMIDSILGGLGLGGNAVATIKNTILEYIKQDKKGWTADHTYTILKFFGFSPTVGSKGRKLYSAIQTFKFNEDVIKEMSMLDIDNPRWSVIANLISAVFNVPLDRLVKKIDNVDAALTEDITAAQRLALLMGWNTWDLDIDDSDVVAVEDEIKEKKKIETEEKKKIKKEEKKKEKEAEEKIIEQNFIEDQKKEREDGKKDITCVAVSKNGTRCKNKVDGNNTYCTIHESVEQGTKEVQCKKIKSDKKRCKMKTKAKSGYCYYHD